MVRLLGYFFGIGVVMALLVAAGIALYIGDISKDLPDYEVLAKYEPPVTTRVHASDGALMAEFAETLWEELDYVSEAANAERFAAMYAGDDDVVIPRVYRQHTTGRVIVLENVEAIKITDVAGMRAAGIEPVAVADLLLDAYFRQFFVEGFFHADPHPGNLLVRADGGIGLVDFGCVETLGRGQADEVRELYRIPIDDTAGLDAQYRRLGLYAATDPDARAKRAALLALQRANVGRFHAAGAWDFGRAEPMRELAGCLREVARLGIASGPLVLFERSQFGLYGLLHQIGARVDCRQVITPFLAG